MRDLPADTTEAKVYYPSDYGEHSATYPIERRKVDSNPENCGWVMKYSGNISIHPTAFLGKDVIVIGPDVEIRENAKIEGKVEILGNVFIGKETILKFEQPESVENRYKCSSTADELEFLRTLAAIIGYRPRMEMLRG